MKPTLKYALLLLITITSFVSCSKDDNKVEEKIEGLGEISFVLTLMGDYANWDIGFIGKTTTTQTENADYKITYENTGEVVENGYIRVSKIEKGVSKHTITSGKRVDVLAVLMQVPYPTKSVSDFEYKMEIFVDGKLKKSYIRELTTTNYGDSNSTHKHLYKIDGGLVIFP